VCTQNELHETVACRDCRNKSVPSGECNLTGIQMQRAVEAGGESVGFVLTASSVMAL
jgi:hypothetical protein